MAVRRRSRTKAVSIVHLGLSHVDAVIDLAELVSEIQEPQLVASRLGGRDVNHADLMTSPLYIVAQTITILLQLAQHELIQVNGRVLEIEASLARQSGTSRSSVGGSVYDCCMTVAAIIANHVGITICISVGGAGHLAAELGRSLRGRNGKSGSDERISHGR